MFFLDFSQSRDNKAAGGYSQHVDYYCSLLCSLGTGNYTENKPERFTSVNPMIANAQFCFLKVLKMIQILT